MKPFTDRMERQWELTINVGSLKRVRDLTGTDLVAILDKDLAAKLASDPILLVDVLYALCKPQADAKSIGDADFGEGMAGDPIETATTALLEELADFFPNHRRAVMKAALAKANQVQALLVDRAAKRVEEIDVENLANDIEKALTPSNESAGSSPESSVSIRIA